jgi:hypothetical protein
VNVGVSIIDESDGARIDPFFLGAKDESSVQGFAGTPVDVNALTYDYLAPVGAAGAMFPRRGLYYVAVDAGRSQFTNASLGGSYLLRSWVNDVTPPSLRLLTTRVAAGRPTLVFRTLDAQSGVDPASLTIAYGGALVAVGSYDWSTGIALFPLPDSAPKLVASTSVRTKMISSDFQEAKNIDTLGPNVIPNTRTKTARMRVVAGIAVNWLTPATGSCAAKPQRMLVAASSRNAIRTVRFRIDGHLAAVDRNGDQNIWSATLPTLSKGRHVLTAVAVDSKRRHGITREVVRACSR